ncbi:MAG: hypothetical protein M1830_005854, partial [Pleopsidium flavum]
MPLIFDRRVNNPAEEEESYVKPAPPTKPSKQSSKDEEELAKADDMAARVKKLKDKGGVNQGSKSSATASQQEAQKQRVGGVNHFVLAVAERDSGSEDGVRMTYINSASTPLMNILRATARNIVRNSSWMSEGVWPRFTAEVMQRVPQQVSGSVCGTHVVLNAWAYMLNIRINATWSTSSDEKSYFYMEARTVINLALRGLMDSETILSFLTSYGYAHYQSPDQIPQRPRGIRSVFMNVDIFDDIVDRMRRAERHRGKITSTGPSRGSPSGSTTGHAPGGSGGSSNPPRVLHVPPKTNPPLLPPKAKSPLLPPKQNPPLLPPKGLTNPPKTAPPTIILPISLLPKAGATPTGNPTGGVAPITVAVPFEGTRQKTWAGLLREGIRDCQNKRVNLGKHNFYQFGKKNQQLLDEDVHFPIAAVWRGLWMNNIRFAFGAADVFRLCRQPDKSGHGLLSVGAPHPLIIPLIFNSDDDQVAAHLLNIKTGQFRSLNGHFMLAVAERESQSSLNVRLRIMDSAPGFVDITIIRAAAQNIVRFSGWMGLTRAGTPMTVRPTFTEEIIRVPRQTSQITCGLHVVFNAWAYMLGMQITPNEFLKSRSTTNDLYKNGRELIDLATN